MHADGLQALLVTCEIMLIFCLVVFLGWLACLYVGLKRDEEERREL